MKYFYIAATIKQDKKDSTFTDQTARDGYYSYVIKCTESDNLKSVLEHVGGLVNANICTSKTRAAELVSYWNICACVNGTYLFE